VVEPARQVAGVAAAVGAAAVVAAEVAVVAVDHSS
jgi:hypothetical protein